MVIVTHARPHSHESLDIVSEALGGLSLACSADMRGTNRPCLQADEIRLQIVIHMGLNPLYDDSSTFFVSNAKLSSLYDGETMSYCCGSSSTPTLPASSVPRPEGDRCPSGPDHLHTYDDLEFAGMVDGGGDLILDALCVDSNSYPSSPMSSEEGPPTARRMKTARLL